MKFIVLISVSIVIFLFACKEDDAGTVSVPPNLKKSYTIQGSFLDTCQGKAIQNLNLEISGFINGDFTDPEVIEYLGSTLTDSLGQYSFVYESTYNFDEIGLFIPNRGYLKYDPKEFINPRFIKEFTFYFDVVLQLDRQLTNTDTLFFGPVERTSPSAPFTKGDIRVGPFSNGDRLRFSYKNGSYQREDIQFVSGLSWGLGSSDLKGTNTEGTKFYAKNSIPAFLVQVCGPGDDVIVDLRGR